MAQVLPHYSLCPLIEQDNFLGLAQDVDGDTAVVTVNANVISRYRISDPKLLHSWYSKGSISSPCIYDAKNDRYVAIFNGNEVRMWTATDEFIDKLKKYKFAENLYKLLLCPRTEDVILVYRNGNVSYLASVLDNRKSFLERPFIQHEDEIISCDVYLLNTVMVTFVIRGPDSEYRILSMSPDQKEPALSKSFRSPEDNTLLGHCLVVEKDFYLITLWSDGKLYRELLRQDTDLVISNPFTCLENLDLRQNVVMKVLAPHLIAVCGAKDEGFLLMIYSTKYNLILCQQYYQNQQMLSQLWNLESKLFLILGHNLVVAQYVEENRKLSTLIGSNIQPESVENLPEAEICKNVVPALLQSNDVEGIASVFDNHSDIPDSVLIDILFWALKNEKGGEEIIYKILDKYIISDVCKLRSVFNVDLALLFLDLVMTNLNNSNMNIRLIKWASLFMDAFYLQLITLNDKAIVEKLNTYLDVLKKELESLNQFKQLMTIMSCIKRKKIIAT